MTVWSELLAEIRTELQDNGTTPKWSDGTIYVFAKDALRDYSTWFPRRIDRYEIAADGNGAYALPTDFVDVVSVEAPEGSYLEKQAVRSGTRKITKTATLSYSIQGGSLYLNYPQDSIFLTYLALHPIPTSESDDTFVITVPDADMELIRLYVKAKCHEQMRAKQSSLDRFKVSGRRDDNPVEEEVLTMMAEYRLKVAERTRSQAVILHRMGRMR